nr:unnamed protein product [Spirometra erinaceieuropaei]
MPQVAKWAVSFMAARFNNENIKKYWDLAELLKSEQLINACLQHIKTNIEATVASDIFNQPPADTVLSILRADDLIGGSEESVFKSIGLWSTPLVDFLDTRFRISSRRSLLHWQQAASSRLEEMKTTAAF